MKEILHPTVRKWFYSRFPDGPTKAQELAWPHIANRQNTLIAAPTGSGKTLAAFMIAISQLHKERQNHAHKNDKDTAAPTTSVVYVSPLKALANDIRENLITPLMEMEEIDHIDSSSPHISVAVRTGDTSQSERTSMLKNPPDLLVTTPESLYLLLTAEKSRETLRNVHTVIVDEIHALARDKRGSHLALSLERLAHVSSQPITRIGLSATQKPIQTLANLLVGANPNRDNTCEIVNTGLHKELDIGLELPPGELQAVAPLQQLDATVKRLAELIAEHRTTLIFVNTRRMAERLAHLLDPLLVLDPLLEQGAASQKTEPNQKTGDRLVGAHHGSLSLARRERMEARLRAGELKALVATASLELGIDVGPIDLVCQIGSPRSFATFLQRVGRANHGANGIPKGRLFPFTRDELLECNAIFAGLKKHQLDEVIPPIAPLDILAQQLVAECGAEPWNTSELFDLARGAWPFKDLSPEEFSETLDFVSNGVETGRGKRGAYIHLDKINNKAEGRRGARMTAIRSGGAIPDIADYRVVAEPDETYLGTVHEDFAVESMAGDVFLLGTHPWKVLQVGSGVVRVKDAAGLSPTIPFWLGEAPARSRELSDEISEMNSQIEEHLKAGDTKAAKAHLMEVSGIQLEAAELSINYLESGLASLGALPTKNRLIVERFFDDTGGAQLVIHNPRGGRINKALGLALRKRFCRTFDFELQAAANDNSVVISLGPHHSFPLSDVAKFLNSKTVFETLHQAVLATPLFTARWRWNLNRALTITRFKGSGRNPPQIQRMEADDLMAVVFPQLAACQDNNAGPIEIPDHLLVRQTLHDTLTEALDAEGLKQLIIQIENQEIEVHLAETLEPSPLAHEILNGRPYTFLDDAPLEERRTQAVSYNRSPNLEDIGGIEESAIKRVRAEIQPTPRSANELHDLLMSLVIFSPPKTTGTKTAGASQTEAGQNSKLEELYAELEEAGRVQKIQKDSTPEDSASFWCPTELKEDALKLLLETPDPTILLKTIRGYLEISGPVTESELTQAIDLPIKETNLAAVLYALENEGVAIQGSWPAGAPNRWCSRRLLSRIHAYSKKQRRQSINPVSAQDFMRFLLRWQHVQPGYRLNGPDGLASIIFQLQGMEIPAASWESHILKYRMTNYTPMWLDQLCYSGEVAWGRLSQSGASTASRATRATPISLFGRTDLSWLISVMRGFSNQPPASGSSASEKEPEKEKGLETGVGAEIREILSTSGAHFFSELVEKTGRLPSDVENGLWDGVARGLLTADSFGAIRSLFFSKKMGSTSVQKRMRHRRHLNARYHNARQGNARQNTEPNTRRWAGRWAVFQNVDNNNLDIEELDIEELAEEWALQLLERWGIIFYDLLLRENHCLPWRNILWALRRLEARGVILGGRFVQGFSGEQYGLPEAADDLMQANPPTDESLTISAADPLNLTGILFRGPRIPAISSKSLTLTDGIPQPAQPVESPEAILLKQ